MKRIKGLSLILLVVLLGACRTTLQNENEDDVAMIEASLDRAAEQYTRMDEAVPDSLLPRTINPDDTLWTHEPGWWTSGFFPGSLWYLYEHTGDPAMKARAEARTWLIEGEKHNAYDHDIGFKINDSFGNALRITGDTSRYAPVIVTAAETLLERFDPDVGLIRSWGDRTNQTEPYLVIIDNMMNLDLLFDATELSGDSSFYEVAVTHADNTLKHHFRPDGSSYHVLELDPQTGEVLHKRTAQGAADSSAWARGQAWGLYGFTETYGNTGEERYLAQAKKIADFILTHPRLPEDGVPYWDFDAPGIPDTYRDASAGAITAAALLELSGYVDDDSLRTAYRDAARQILRSLSQPPYRAEVGENHNFLLRHSVGSLPGDSEVDVPLTYADYYYLEGLLRLQALAQEAEISEPQVIAENGAWTWFNDERAIIAGDDLFVGYVDTAGYTSATVVPLNGEGEVQRRRLGAIEQVDDHNNPAFVELEGGRVLAVYALHHAEPHWYWRHADGSSDTVGWTAEQRTENLGARTTYANLFRLDDEGGRIYNFFRGTNFNPTLMTSEDGGETWSAPQHFIISGSGETRPYFKYASDGAGRIDVVYTQGHPRLEENDVFHVYYEDGYMHRSDGTRIQPLPGTDGAGPMPVGAGTQVYEADTAGRAWVWDLEYAADGTPVAAYIAARDGTVGNDLRYRYARWDAAAGQWREQEIAYAGTHLYDGENHYAGGITLDPVDTRTVYTSSDVHPATGDTTNHYEIYRGATSDDGATWDWTPLTPDATADNIRPFAVRGGDALLWLRGRYTAYEDYDTDVVGLIE